MAISAPLKRGTMIIPTLVGTLNVLRYCGKSSPNNLLVVGGVHGDEPESAALTRLIRLKLDTAHLNSNHDIYFVERYNPWGLAKNTLGNENGVDLNRNFPTLNWSDGETSGKNFHGTMPGSEAETKSFMQLVENVKPTLIITLHEPFGCIDFDGPLNPMSPIISQLHQTLKLPVQQVGARPGSMGTYCGVERSIPVVTIELEKGNSQEWLTANAFSLAQIFMLPLS